jgi:hypothetical protein
MTSEDVKRRCACGFEAAEFASGLASIENKIGELRVYENRLSPDLIKLHQQVTGHALEHLHNVKGFCNIDTTEEEKLLIKVQTDLSQINNFEKRNELADNTSRITIGIREKLYKCKQR